MVWILLSLSFLLHTPRASGDSLLTQKSRQQVKKYIANIRLEKEPDINLWALSEAGQNKTEMKKFTARYLQQRAYDNASLKIFEDSTLGYTKQLRRLAFQRSSSLLLVIYLLAEPNPQIKRTTADRFSHTVGYNKTNHVNYAALIRALLKHTSITNNMLPAGRFHPLHFFLFYNKQVMKTHPFSSDYLEKAAKKWYSNREISLQNEMRLAGLFRIFYSTYQYDKAEALYHPLVQNQLLPYSKETLNIMRALDYTMYRLGYYNRSLAIIRNHSLPLARYLGHENIAHEIQVSRGAYLYRIGKIEESREIYQNVKKYVKNHKSSVSKGRLLNNLAIDYWKSGDFDQYLTLEFKSLKQAENEKNYSLRLNILKNLFTHYRVNKNFISAKQYLNKAKILAQKENNKKDLAQLSYYEGQLYRDSKSNYPRAIASFDHALSLISNSDYYRSYQNISLDKARLLDRQHQFQQAQTIYQKVLEHAHARNDRRNTLTAAFNKANTHLELGQQKKARVMLDTLNTQNLEALDFYQLVKARTVQARYQKQYGRAEKGVAILSPVVHQIQKRSRGSGDIESGFWQVEPEYLNAFELYANLLIQTNRPGRAVEALDRLKTINDVALYQNPLVRSKVLNEKELSQYKRLTDQLDELRRRLLASPKDDQQKIQQKINELSSTKSGLNQKISSQANRQPVSVRQIQRRLSAHRRVLHITELNDTYYIATISRTTVRIKKIPITPALRHKFEDSIRRMREGDTDLNQLYTLTKLLGLNDLPSYVDKLTIIPDSYLYELPMDVLPIAPPQGAQSFGRAHYLIERYETNYMTSLNDFNHPKRKSHYKYGFAGYGVSTFAADRKALIPLPQAKTEIRDIEQQLTAFHRKKMYLNDRATAQTFERAAPDARILHLATHSRVDNNNPLFSSIYLRRTDGPDQKHYSGRIFAYQLFNLNLSNELVMLNSCESGAGAYLQGTGVVGISRALRYAGAKSLVLNMWSVNDMMAAEFASHFYHAINRGDTKSEALQDAKLYFLKHNNANPHYWGSYMLLGNKSALVKTDHWTNRVVGGSFMFFFLSIAFASSYVEIRKRA